jgi:hypothetical protein
MPGLVGLDLAGAAHPAGPIVDGRQRVRALVRVRSDHNHPHRPFVESLKRTFGGQLSVGAMPRSY